MASVAAVIEEFRQRAGRLRCIDVCKALRSLGFEVREGDGPGHKVVSHQALKGFHGTNFNCGHGKNPEVNRPYVKNLIRVLQQWQPELEEANDV
jgi:hypothetical protein